MEKKETNKTKKKNINKQKRNGLPVIGLHGNIKTF